MIEAIQNKTPVLSLPFNPDQIIHGTRMQELGIGRCLFTINLRDLKEIFSFNWKHIEDKGKRLDINIILNEVKSMLQDLDKYKEAIKKFNYLYPYKNGAKQIADILEDDPGSH